MNALRISLLLSLPLSASFAGLAVADDPPRLQAEHGCDTTNIRWVLPADFKTALERSKSERRLLLIKGVSFNVDEAGATCATKGTW